MSENTRSPAWQTSLNPALVQRLHRDAGIIPQALARRILGWSAYFSRRTGDFVEILRQRGSVGALRVNEVPIVHAHWGEEHERVWPVAVPSPSVLVVQARPSIERSEHKAPPGRGDAPRAPAIKAAPVEILAAARAAGGAPAPILASTPTREITPAERAGAPTGSRIDLAEIKAAPAPRLAAAAIEPAPLPVVKTSQGEARVSAPRVDTVAPVAAPRAPDADLAPGPSPVPAGHRTIVGRTEAPGAVVILLPPARRVARGAALHLAATADRDSPSLPGAAVEERPRSAAIARALQSPLPEVVAPDRPSAPAVPPVAARASAPRRLDSFVAHPAPRETPLGRVSQRPRVSSIVAHGEPSLPLVVGARRAAPPPARRVRPALVGETPALKVAAWGAPVAARSPIIHAGQGATGEAPRRQEPTAAADRRPLLTRSPLEALETPQLSAVPRPAEGPSAARPPRPELDIDTVVEKVERRMLKNLAVERERKGGVR
ncbi:MAG: hypothetical protein ABJE95_08005 [Byssovorax sp.]